MPLGPKAPSLQALSNYLVLPLVKLLGIGLGYPNCRNSLRWFLGTRDFRQCFPLFFLGTQFLLFGIGVIWVLVTGKSKTKHPVNNGADHNWSPTEISSIFGINAVVAAWPASFRFSLYHFVNLMVGYVVGRFGLFDMEKLRGNLLVCAARFVNDPEVVWFKRTSTLAWRAVWRHRKLEATKYTVERSIRQCTVLYYIVWYCMIDQGILRNILFLFWGLQASLPCG